MKPHPTLPYVFIDNTIADGFSVTIDTATNTIDVENESISFNCRLNMQREITLRDLDVLSDELQRFQINEKMQIF